MFCWLFLFVFFFILKLILKTSVACLASIESHFIQIIRIVVNLELETVLFFPLKHVLSDFILGMHRNKSFRTGKKPTSLDLLFLLFFVRGGGGGFHLSLMT